MSRSATGRTVHDRGKARRLSRYVAQLGVSFTASIPIVSIASVPNPWDGVTMEQRTKTTKPAATREQVYQFAWGAIEAGRPESAAAAVICFEFLQRPENVLAGYLAWPDYRGQNAPNAIKITHHKTGAIVWHPLEEMTDEGAVKFYGDAEAVLATCPAAVSRWCSSSAAMAPRAVHGDADVQDRPQAAGPARPASTFTLDACRHGGMTELEEAELTDGQGRALSGHRTQRAYEGTRSGHWSAPCPPPEALRPCVWRTPREHPFRMGTSGRSE